MSYCGYVTKLKNIRTHPNADKLILADVFNETVIVDKSANENDLMIYFPSDGQLSEEFCKTNDLLRRKDENGKHAGGFLDPDKRNVRIIKLRGEYSDGLVLPLSSLAYTGVDTSSFSLGDQIIVVNGHEICRKYIPRQRPIATKSVVKKGKVRGKENQELIPQFAEHIDTPQLRFVMDHFKPGDIISLTEKVHGTSSRNANTLVISYKKSWFDKLFKRRGKENREYKYLVGTRRTTIKSPLGGFYGNNQFRIDWGQKFKGKLHEGECIFGEIAGYINNTSTPIMNVADNKKTKDKEFIKRYGKTTTFTYGCEEGESRYFVYRMTYTMPDGTVIEYPWDLVILRAEQMGFETVPELDRFIYTTEEDFLARVNKWLDTPSTIDCRHIIEGVVVRALNDPGLKIAKTKSEGFKIIEGIMKADADLPDLEEAEEELIELVQI